MKDKQHNLPSLEGFLCDTYCIFNIESRFWFIQDILSNVDLFCKQTLNELFTLQLAESQNGDDLKYAVISLANQ